MAWESKKNNGIPLDSEFFLNVLCMASEKIVETMGEVAKCPARAVQLVEIPSSHSTLYLVIVLCV